MAHIMINNKPYYYDEIPFTYSVEKLDKDDAVNFLHLINYILTENRVSFFINFGTLLGAYREHDFISHDFDFDLGIFEKDKQSFINLIPILEQNNIKLCGEWGGILYTFIYKGITCDFNVFYRAAFPYSIHYFGVGEFKFVPKKYLREFKLLKFLGENYYVPVDTEGYLEYLYGKDWRTPQKGRGADAMPKWMVLERFYIRVKRKIRFLKAKYITHTEFK